MKRIFSSILVLAVLATVFACPFGVQATDSRYIVLLIDNSAGAIYEDGKGSTMYEADSTMSYAKGAAIHFIENILNANGNQYVSVVTFGEETTFVTDFTNDSSVLISAINQIEGTEEYGVDMSDCLLKVNNRLKEVAGEKHIVLFTGGTVNLGVYSGKGRYNKNVVGGRWVNASTNVSIYMYANAAHEKADKIKESAKLYTVGLFQPIENMPTEGRDIAEFHKLFAKDLATSENHFYAVDDISKLADTFGAIAEDIQLNPSIWATGEIKEAKEIGLIPENLMNKDLSEKITRAEFAAISVELYKALTGAESEEEYEVPFNDISDSDFEEDIKNAYGLNIVVGISETEFSPNARITREDLATMLCRTIKKYKFDGWTVATDSDYYLDSEGTKKFADDAEISGYAKPSVYYLTKMGILNGVSETLFAPKNTTTEQEAQGYATATREQAIALSLRIFKISELLKK